MININITITGAAETAVLQWQPIESSPRTANARLVWCPERRNTYIVSWLDNELYWYHFSGSGGRLREIPTHWMWPPAGPVSP